MQGSPGHWGWVGHPGLGPPWKQGPGASATLGVPAAGPVGARGWLPTSTGSLAVPAERTPSCARPRLRGSRGSPGEASSASLTASLGVKLSKTPVSNST